MKICDLKNLGILGKFFTLTMYEKLLNFIFRMSEDSTEMELIQRINELFTKFVLLDITHEEFCIMKLINFLNHGKIQ